MKLFRFTSPLLLLVLLALPFFHSATPADPVVKSLAALAASPARISGHSAPSPLTTSIAAHFAPDARQELLYAFLYSEEFAAWFLTEDDAEGMIRQRLSGPYPTDRDPEDLQVQHELRARLGIVKAVAETNAPKAKSLLISVLQNHT